jgi:NADPH:quinone reductase-like Zn-dependent oxidoreductase
MAERQVSEMRVARYDRYGPPEVLYEGRSAVPVAGVGEVLVRVHGASVNGSEMMMRSGRLRLLLGGKFPKLTGFDFAGEVAALGPGVTGLAVGERVWGGLARGRTGTAAEFVAVPADRVAASPAGLDLVRAAALPGVGATAITGLRDKLAVREGERLLVRGASGGVGSVAVQWGRAVGARVTALAGARNLDLVRGLGAVEAFDYATTGPTDLGPFDVVFDTVGTELPAYRRLLAPGGRMATIAVASPRSVAYLLASTVFGSRRVRFYSCDPKRALFADLTASVESGAIRPVVDSVFPLTDIAAAHRALEAGGGRGKQVVRVV